MHAFRPPRISQILLFSISLCSLALSGCGGSSGSTNTTSGSTTGNGGSGTTPATVPGLYVFESLASTTNQPPCLVLQYPKTANGVVTPTTAITGPSGFLCESMAIDSMGNIYLGGYTPSAGVVLVYAPGATTPTRTISPTGLGGVTALAVDASGNIFTYGGVTVGNIITSGISEFASTANGTVSPIRVISGDATTILHGVNQMAVDSADNLYIATTNVGSGPPQSILIFNSTATGNAAPTSTIGGDKTGIYDPRGLTLDKGGDLYVSSQGAGTVTPTGTVPGPVSIFEFSIGATGNVAPVRTITGPATMLENSGLAVDSANGNLYAVAHSAGLPAILMFPSTAGGNAAPAAIFYNNNPLLEFNSLVPALF